MKVLELIRLLHVEKRRVYFWTLSRRATNDFASRGLLPPDQYKHIETGEEIRGIYNFLLFKQPAFMNVARHWNIAKFLAYTETSKWPPIEIQMTYLDYLRVLESRPNVRNLILLEQKKYS